jgi:glutathione synthase/RimK-type ligase-like ATP-grasp enzyme
MRKAIHIHNPRLLVVSANKWSLAGQIASALVLAGFAVAVVCPIDSPVYQLRKLHARFRYRRRAPSASIKFAIAAWSPDILVVTDDIAAQELRSLYRASQKRSDPKSIKLMELLEFSLGDPHSFAIAQSKSAILSLAASLGITCPKTTVLTHSSGFTAKDSAITLPVIVKTDDAWGGLGVRVVNDISELRSALAELSLPYNLPEKLKRVVGRMFRARLSRWILRRPGKISIQQYVAGRPCTRAVVCWKGKVLAGITVEVLATLHKFGPAAVVQVIHHPSVAEATERIVAKLGLSGFLGFDFILDAADKSWFLEMNPRATPTCCISEMNEDLAGSFFVKFTGESPKTTGCIVDHDVFTLFPYGTLRAMQMIPDLPIERGAPKDEPEYVRRCHTQQDAEIRNWIWYSSLRAPSEVK